jgi:hypothetical protein
MVAFRCDFRPPQHQAAAETGTRPERKLILTSPKHNLEAVKLMLLEYGDRSYASGENRLTNREFVENATKRKEIYDQLLEILSSSLAPSGAEPGFCPTCVPFCEGHPTPSAPPQVDVVNTLTNACQVFDGWHQDGTAWSEWDESVRKDLSSLLKYFSGNAAPAKAVEAKCPNCGEPMQKGFFRVSQNSVSAIKVRCQGSETHLAFHEFVLSKWEDFAQFFFPQSTREAQ